MAKKIIGRPANPDALSFDSMAAACAHIGGDCTPDLLKAAKKAGCNAFRSGRIYVKELTDWLKKNKVDPSAIKGKEALQIRKLAEECRRLTRENEVAEGRLVAIAEIEEINARLDAQIISSAQEIFLSDASIKRAEGCNFAEMKRLRTEEFDRWLEIIHAPSRNQQA